MPRFNNNPAGKNGYGAKNYPPDNVLKSSLLQYAKEGLLAKERLDRLRVEHHLVIGKTKLKELNNKFKVPTVRKPPPDDVALQAVMQKVAEDVNQSNGVGSIRTMLGNEGISLPRRVIRAILAANAPEGLALRFPGARRIPRRALEAIGPNQQWHADGHEKLGEQALDMGGVGIGIYSFRDQSAGFDLLLMCAPNIRKATTTAHIHLDCIELHGMIPVTQVTDKGSETGYLYAHQVALRAELAPDISTEEYPPYKYLRSVHNTPIESFWTWFGKHRGRNLKDIIRSGLTNNQYNPADQMHKKLFNWLWPKIVQRELDEFRAFWNNHRIRYQREKKNISGTTPRNGWTVPESYGGRQCGIPVPQSVIDGLRSAIPVSREEAYRWPGVDDESEAFLTELYNDIGSPALKAVDGWAIFTELANMLEQDVY